MKERSKAPVVLVRPKASQRKARSAVVPRNARAPTQERSQKRFDAILDATQELLEKARIEDISFSDIARKAGISPASVHYLFPNIAAVRVELSRRNNRDLVAQIAGMAAELVESREPSWQQWLRSLAGGARRVFNSSRAVFIVPEIPNLEMMLSLASEVFDALWSRSYMLQGHIDDETFEESMRVVLAYMRAVLPETLTLRAAVGRPEQRNQPSASRKP